MARADCAMRHASHQAGAIARALQHIGGKTMGAELLRRVVRIGAAGMLTMAAGPSLALLDAVPAGEWALREIGGSAPARLVCVRNPQLLIQIQHGAAACRRFVVSGGPRSATIEYSCAGQGHGRTLITVERSTLLRIQTQGLRQGAPFDVDYEARYRGTCDGT